MAKGYVLSQADRDILQTMISQFKLERKNTTNRPGPEGDLSPAKANYIALVPAGGIPALDAVLGTGSEAGLYIPGSAYCLIYRIVQRFGGPLLVPVFGLSRLVYNLSTLVVAAGWVSIAKDKFGSWTVSGGGGSGGESPPGFGPGGGSCDLAMLTPNDTLLATDGDQEITLAFDSPSGHWLSIASGTGTGSGSDALLSYPLGEGALDFWFANGSLHLALDGLELLNCGDGCFTGGPLTGHVYTVGTGSPEEPCTGETFTICISCIGAVVEADAGTGTGTGGEETGTGGGGTIAEDCCPDVLIPATLTATVTATTGDCSCYAGKSATITYGNDPFFGDRWRGSSSAPPCLSVPSGDPATRFEVIVYCALDGVTWEAGLGCIGTNSFVMGSIGSVTCSPFLMSNVVISSGGGNICCTGTVTLTITE